jgi:hypothetical protein
MCVRRIDQVSMKARRLKVIAEEINRLYPMFTAKIEAGYSNTDRKIVGSRLRVPGKGRRGNRLVVRWRSLSQFDPRSLVLDHNAAEAYRYNGEVERWLSSEAPKIAKEGPRP